MVHKILSPQEWEVLQSLTVCIALKFLLSYFNIVYCIKVSNYGLMQALCLCRFLRLA